EPLERPQVPTSPRTGPARLEPAPDREVHDGAPRNGERVSQSRRDPRASPSSAKTGQSQGGVHRPRNGTDVNMYSQAHSVIPVRSAWHRTSTGRNNEKLWAAPESALPVRLRHPSCRGERIVVERRHLLGRDVLGMPRRARSVTVRPQPPDLLPGKVL